MKVEECIIVGVRGMRLLQNLPDIPRYMYVRWMLLSGKGRVFMSKESDGTDAVVQHPANGLTCVVGMPAPDTLYEAVEASDIPVLLLADPENALYIRQLFPYWSASTAHMHVLTPEATMVLSPTIPVRFLDRQEIRQCDHLSEELQAELLDAAIHSPIAAAFEENLPVSFCYVAAETETLWDVSIDTVEPYRQKGYARQVLVFMIGHMQKMEKRSVYGVEESNIGSIKLAQKLGFKPIDTLILFNR